LDESEQGFDDTSVETGVWRYARASRVRVIVDAADYFEQMQLAMVEARQRVLLIGWDFDTRIHLTFGRRWWQKGRRRTFPSRLGSFVPWLARHRKGLHIHVLKWGFGAIKLAFSGRMTLDILRWMPHPRIGFKFDTAHPIGCSHHQKIAIIDDRLAVCGGIDMADRRWDTRDHLEHDRRRRRPHGKPYGPWHDITMMMEGDVASELDGLARERWHRAGGEHLADLTPSDRSAWPEALEPHFTDVEIGIARTRAAYGDCPEVHEVEELHLAHIARAKRFIYSENQYFTSRRVAEAITARLIEPDPPEFIMVQPETADGWLEERAMNPARDRILAAIREIDHKGRFHLYTPMTGATPIYVHAKLTIIDDEVLRIGSANLNNRSMRLDSECDVFIDATRPGNEAAGPTIAALRHSLLAEHCGLEPEEIAPLVEEAGSMAAMIDRLGKGRSRTLRRFEPEEHEGLVAEVADRQLLDPENPEDLLALTRPRRGLFRSGGLLARAMTRLKRRRASR
jgi:phosphatidylserine/phosphatidylglycerophosphate/cardiolipin synthase-like enzyme